MKLQSSLLLVSLMLGLAPRVHAWDDFGHMQVAAVAFEKLSARSKARASQLLKQNPSYPYWIVGVKKSGVDRAAFTRAATWADAIKRDKSFTHDDDPKAPTASQNIGYADKLPHGYWHFIDLPFSADGTKTEPVAEPNAQTQIAAFRAALSSNDVSDEVKSYDLVWLMHLVGDVHQPLHCVTRFDKANPPPLGDKGGNNEQITGNQSPPICNDSLFCPFGPPSVLHAFWDAVTGDSYSLSDVYAAARELPRPGIKESAIGDEAVWIQEGFKLAQSAVYVAPIGVGNGPFTIDAPYQRAALELARQRISLAAERLARLLNDCFDHEARAR